MNISTDKELVSKINYLVDKLDSIQQGPPGESVTVDEVIEALLQRNDFLSKVRGSKGETGEKGHTKSVEEILHEYTSLPKEKKWASKGFFKDSPFSYYQVSSAGSSSSTTTTTGATNWLPLTIYTANDLVINAGSLYRVNVTHTSETTFNSLELLNLTFLSGNPVTEVTADYTVVETDNILNVTGAGPLTITIPATRTNKELHISRLHPDPITVITIATSGGETIVNPTTGVASASTPMPGIKNTNAFMDYYLVGTVWQAA